MIRVVDFLPTGPTSSVVERPAKEAFLMPPEANTCRWVDITDQTPEEMEALRKGFGFHPLALEDCLHFDQRPKLEEFSGANPHMFLVIHGFTECAASRKGEPDTIAISRSLKKTQSSLLVLRLEEIHAFLGPNYLVTVHKHPLVAIDTVWQRLHQDAPWVQRSCDFLYYLIADHLCDQNFRVLERVSDELDEIEENVVGNPRREVLTAIYEIRKVLVAMRRTLSPQRDLMALLARHGGNNGYIQSQVALYFRDVYDHLVRINEAIESGRDLLGNCVDAYLSAVAQRTNEIVKQLTILSSIMLPLSFIVGFFGMNFQNLIPFDSKPLFIFLLLLMFFAIPGGMLFWFRYKKWI